VDEFLTKQEAAQAFKIKKRTLDYLVYTGQIPFFKDKSNETGLSKTKSCKHPSRIKKISTMGVLGN
jgi:hypothetical protein